MSQVVPVVSEPSRSPGAVVALRSHVVLRQDECSVVPRHDRGETVTLVAALVFTLALHVAVLAAFAFSPPEDTSGAGGQHLEAIEVTLVTSTVLASRESKQAEPAAAAKAELAPEEGDQAPVDANARKPAEEVREPQAAQPAPVKAQPEPLPKEPEPLPPPPQPQSRGGVAALTPSEGAAQAGGPAAASPGEISRYAAAVRNALARRKPEGRGRHGVATVTFTISAAGWVKGARITASSGVEALDQMALAAVERTAFPVPPATLTERDLTYVIPFRFQ